MTDTTTPRVTTERARELVEAATPGPWSCHQHPRGKSLARLEFGDIQIRGWSVWVDGLDEHLADAALISAAPDLAADLIAARATIDAMRAERDALQAAAVCVICGTRDPGCDEDGLCGCGGQVIVGSLGAVEHIEEVLQEYRGAVADLAAARELRGVVTAAEHARAVREAWVVFCRPLYADRGRSASDADIAGHWRECDTRTRLVARLVRSGLTEAQAAALADGGER